MVLWQLISQMYIMSWEIKLERRAEKDLERIPEHHQKRVLATLSVLAADPFLGKKLQGELRGLYSYRVWPYRIIYKPQKRLLIIVIIRISHRQGSYG